MFPHHWSGHPRGPGPGIWYHDTIDPDGSPRARIRYGSAGKRLLAGMRAAVRPMLDCGNHIVLDEMPLDESILPAWRRELAGHQVTWIRLSAPLSVIEQREAQRTRGQHLGNARGHFLIGADDQYDLHVDVATRSPNAVAAEIGHPPQRSGETRSPITDRRTRSSCRSAWEETEVHGQRNDVGLAAVVEAR